MNQYQNLLVFITFRILYVLIQQKKNNLIQEKNYWNKNSIILWPFIENYIPESFICVTPILNTCTISHLTHIHHRMNETMEHKLHRIKRV